MLLHLSFPEERESDEMRGIRLNWLRSAARAGPGCPSGWSSAGRDVLPPSQAPRGAGSFFKLISRTFWGRGFIHQRHRRRHQSSPARCAAALPLCAPNREPLAGHKGRLDPLWSQAAMTWAEIAKCVMAPGHGSGDGQFFFFVCSLPTKETIPMLLGHGVTL